MGLSDLKCKNSVCTHIRQKKKKSANGMCRLVIQLYYFKSKFPASEHLFVIWSFTYSNEQGRIQKFPDWVDNEI
jgi:hypothetical protein